MYEDIKGGLSAELIRDRGFDEQPNALGLPRYWERDPDDRNDDGALNFSWDGDVFLPDNGESSSLSSQHSLRVAIQGSGGQRRGIHQGSIPIRAGIEYSGYIWLKSADYNGDVAVTLEADQTGGERYASATLNQVTGDWKKYPFKLRPSKSDPLAKIAVLFAGHGKLWIDQVSLVPADAEGGVRHDVEQLVAALHPAFIRWPGGNVAQDYHWKWGIGPRDLRPVWGNASWGNELEPSDFGTEEFVQFARRVGAEPSITVNVEGGGATAEEAAAWVQYCNGDPQSEYGRMRSANGSPEPFHVKYWEIGNEIWGDWVRGHSDAITYANNLNRYVEKMKAMDPSIKIIASGDNNLDWDRKVLEIAGRNIDYLAVHHYYGPNEMKGDPNNLRAHPLPNPRGWIVGFTDGSESSGALVQMKTIFNAKHLNRTLLQILVWLAIAVVALGQQNYSGRGMILKVDSSRRSLLVSCDAIPGYMDAMTMPLLLRKHESLVALRPGMVIDFSLVVENNSAYADSIRVHTYQGLEPDPLSARRLSLLNKLVNASAKPLATGDAVPDFTLTGQDGRPVTFSNYKGKVVALNFIYTRCALPNFCFRSSNNFGNLQRRFRNRLGKQLVLLTVTFDPVHDSPEALAKYARIWKADPRGWHFLTGAAMDIQRICDRFGVDFFPDEGLMDHSLHTAVIDRRGRLVANLEGNEFTEEQLGDLVNTVLTQEPLNRFRK